MRLSNILERDLGTNEAVSPAKPDSTFADRAFVGYRQINGRPQK
jgi:hypothetical protein